MTPDLGTFVVLVPIVLGSLALHELAHAYTAFRLGDPTAKLLGRLTFNPLAHLDPLGTLMFAITYFSSSFLFGWAKPVPVDPRNLRGNPQRGMALVAVAGPLTNFALALVAGGLLAHLELSLRVYEIVYQAMLVNIVLGIFNLIPIPPLDGSRIAGAFMPRELYLQWSAFDQYGIFVLLGLLFFTQRAGVSLFSGVYGVALDVISGVVGGAALPPV